MADVAVIGGGPAGLSAALFTAKNGHDTTLFDTDETWMHKAHLYNYLGIDDIGGTEFVERGREQVDEFGVERHDAEVTDVEETGSGFSLRTQDGEYDADYVVFAAGGSRDLAADLGCDRNDDGTVAVVNQDNETTVDRAYAAGRMIRDQKIEAIISAGDGAAAALGIMSAEAGKPVHDFDTPE
ncbi:FAD-dependent oxidoreductase [Halostella sp. JP-L12]|uniref:NAD(P)/FAD-dependent oxidoreductase n=1 Tax=Halostella TaxID=1843185 RepID=UPI000EF7EAC2|nr:MULTISPECIES: NAD(P)/FAD-dependent oxidoreductase [Halostella]NHN49560.1 FAD-dependent oxidoreductase [Halostella sp. JP-L12]